MTTFSPAVIRYNGNVIGSSSSARLLRYSVKESTGSTGLTETAYSIKGILQSDTPANFETALADLRDNFRESNKAFKVEIGGATYDEYVVATPGLGNSIETEFTVDEFPFKAVATTFGVEIKRTSPPAGGGGGGGGIFEMVIDVSFNEIGHRVVRYLRKEIFDADAYADVGEQARDYIDNTVTPGLPQDYTIIKGPDSHQEQYPNDTVVWAVYSWEIEQQKIAFPRGKDGALTANYAYWNYDYSVRFVNGNRFNIMREITVTGSFEVVKSDRMGIQSDEDFQALFARKEDVQQHILDEYLPADGWVTAMDFTWRTEKRQCTWRIVALEGMSDSSKDERNIYTQASVTQTVRRVYNLVAIPLAPGATGGKKFYRQKTGNSYYIIEINGRFGTLNKQVPFLVQLYMASQKPTNAALIEGPTVTDYGSRLITPTTKEFLFGYRAVYKYWGDSWPVSDPSGMLTYFFTEATSDDDITTWGGKEIGEGE